MREVEYPLKDRAGDSAQEGAAIFHGRRRHGPLNVPRSHNEKRRRRGIKYGLIGIVLLLEVIAEQFLPPQSSKIIHRVLLIKGVVQSAAVALLGFLAGRMASRNWYSLVILGTLNAVLTFAAGLALGPDQFVDFLQGLYPQSTQVERIHRRHD